MRFGLQINPYFYGSTGNPWDVVEHDRTASRSNGAARVEAARDVDDSGTCQKQPAGAVYSRVSAHLHMTAVTFDSKVRRVSRTGQVSRYRRG